MPDRFETFATTIAFINRCIQKIKAREMEAVGLKSSYVMCMYALAREPEGLTASQLRELCGEDKGAISRSVGDLAAREYVRLETDPPKRAYRSKIVLTRKGQELADYINARVERAMEQASRGISPDSRKELYASLARISRNLQQYLGEAEP